MNMDYTTIKNASIRKMLAKKEGIKNAKRRNLFPGSNNPPSIPNVNQPKDSGG